MKHYVILNGMRYEGIRHGTPSGVEGVDWIEVDNPPSDFRDTWDVETGSWVAPQPLSPDYPSEVILKSPNGTPFKVTVDNDGTPMTEPMT